MANGVTTEICVRKIVKDGWHVYTCEQLPGLYVAHKNDRTAYDDLPEAIRKLVKLDDGVDCTVSHKLSYAEFVQRARLSESALKNLKAATKRLMSEDEGFIPFILQNSSGALAAQ
jgi:hypothetical protein